MATLSDCVVATKCRKGKATGTTKRGAYWLACEPVTLRQFGGDGIGQSGATRTYTLELRHYRDGEVRPTLHYHAWHQNSGASNQYQMLSDLANCETVEQVICELKGTRFTVDEYCGYDEHVFSDYYADELTEVLTALGMPLAEPAPDETA